MVVWTILDHFGPVRFPTVLRPFPIWEGLNGGSQRGFGTCPEVSQLPTIAYNFATKIRDGETTIKIKIAVLRGGGIGGREAKSSKALLFMGNATTIKF